jgi:hypothetical protein
MKCDEYSGREAPGACPALFTEGHAGPGNLVPGAWISMPRRRRGAAKRQASLAPAWRFASLISQLSRPAVVTGRPAGAAGRTWTPTRRASGCPSPARSPGGAFGLDLKSQGDGDCQRMP